MKEKVILMTNKNNRIYCVSNGKYYDTSKAAADELNLKRSNLSKHLKGERQHVGGYVFVRAPQLLTAFEIKKLRENLMKESENIS